MKFYNMAISYGVDGGRVEPIESTKGKWATRADAEQAVKDAVEMAKLAQRKLLSQLTERYPNKKMEEILEICQREPDFLKAQAIIERYEGGKG